MESQQEMTPAERLIQVTLAGNLVILDPIKGTEKFYTANDTHDRFTNDRGEEFTAEEIVAAVNERLVEAVQQRMASDRQTTAAQQQNHAFCASCGKPLVPGDRFCRHCGSHI